MPLIELTVLSGVTQIAAGGYHTLALAGTAIYAWGNNQYGQVGNGTATNRLAPTLVSGSLSFTAVSAGSWHSAALGSDGEIYTWGRNNYGQLGTGTTTDRWAPATLTP